MKYQGGTGTIDRRLPAERGQDRLPPPRAVLTSHCPGVSMVVNHGWLRPEARAREAGVGCRGPPGRPGQGEAWAQSSFLLCQGTFWVTLS